MLSISLVLFGLLQNWRLDFTNCYNVRKKNSYFSCLPLAMDRSILLLQLLAYNILGYQDVFHRII